MDVIRKVSDRLTKVQARRDEEVRSQLSSSQQPSTGSTKVSYLIALGGGLSGSGGMTSVYLHVHIHRKWRTLLC